MRTSKAQLAIVAGFAAMSLSVESLAHGYVSQPKSRSYLCKLGDNTNCGAIQYEPQSVEGQTEETDAVAQLDFLFCRKKN